MTKTQRIETIKQILERAQAVAKKCKIVGVPEWDQSFEHAKAKCFEDLDLDVAAFLNSLTKLEYVRGLRTEELWARYALYPTECATMREVVMLKDAKKEFRKALKQFSTALAVLAVEE